MLITAVLFSTICGYVRSSGVVAGGALAPVVTASSSQYFERTFNRLIAAPAVQPVIPVAPAPPVVVQPVAKATPIPVPPQPVQPIQPNVAIAVATAQAAPVATILLPPYPFGPPPAINFIPSSPPIVVPAEESRTEPTTTTTKVNTKTTIREPEATTPSPSSPSPSDNTFVQALPSNQNVGFSQYYAPPQRLPLEPFNKPQKLKTSVEVERVPLTYIAPPPRNQLPFQQIKHFHTFVPAKTKIIIRPVSAPLRLQGKPVHIVMYRKPVRYTRPRYPQNALRAPPRRDVEPTTFSPFMKPNTKPPRLL